MQSTVDLPRRRRRVLGAAVACAAAVLTTAVSITAPAAAGATPRGGCAAPATPGTSERSLVDGGVTRTYRVHVPDGPARPLPVVLAFHGRGGDGAELEAFSGLSALPAVVMYPDGVPGDEGKTAWTGAPYSAPGVDDVAFTRRMLDDVAATSCVDPARVYATGKSNGGGFAGVVACRLSDRIAAVGIVAGAFYGAERSAGGTSIDTGEPSCAPGRPVPVMEIHGTGDATIPYTGDADRGLPAIPDWVGGWVGRDRCVAPPRTTTVGPDVTDTRWRGCAGGAEVAHVAVDGGGHTWPGATGYSGGGATTQTVRATTLIWDFVSRFRLPTPGSPS